MPWIIILIVIISIISKANKKKKAEEAAKKARQAQAFEQAPTPPPQRTAQGRSARFPDEFEGTPPPRPRQVTMEEVAKRNDPVQAEMEARRKAMQQTMLPPQKKAASPTKQPIDTTLTHVVKPVTESRHAHTESSMGGGEACPVPVAVKPLPSLASTEPKAELPSLGFSREDVVRGLLYAEILGKPKALRK